MKIPLIFKTPLTIDSEPVPLSCNKSAEEHTLQELTHKGNNTFAYYLDEIPYIARTNLNGPNALSGFLNEASNLFRIQGTREDDNVAFKVIVDNGLSNYPMNFETAHLKGHIDSSGGNCFYFHHTLNRGAAEITRLYETIHIIAGRFSITLINPDCGGKSTMDITEGRFDIEY
ncbi:MAG: hypothetical protein ACI8ZM_000337 [Crocinitomix sp.]|jgi:hypothetical protein